MGSSEYIGVRLLVGAFLAFWQSDRWITLQFTYQHTAPRGSSTRAPSSWRVILRIICTPTSEETRRGGREAASGGTHSQGSI